jgi:hypothetical protein
MGVYTVGIAGLAVNQVSNKLGWFDSISSHNKEEKAAALEQRLVLKTRCRGDEPGLGVGSSFFLLYILGYGNQVISKITGQCSIH